MKPIFPFFSRKSASTTSSEGDFAEKPAAKAISGGDLTSEFAVRMFSQAMSSLSYLPNPDPILRSEGIQLSTYRQMIDGHLGAVKRKRRAAVRGRPWRLNPNGASARSFKLLSSIMEDLDVRETMSHLWSANLLGYSVVETMWESRGGLLVPVDLLDKPQEWFGWHADRSLRFIDDNGLGEPVPPRKFLVARSEPTYTNPYGYPLLSECFWPLAFKRGGLRFWMTFLEKYGMPRAIGKVPTNASTEERNSLLTSLIGMVRDAAMVISNNQSVELQEATGKSSSTSAYSEIVKWADSEISKAILGETLTTELSSSGGSRAAAEVHNDVRKDLAQDDASLIEKHFNQLIRWFYELNFPGETVRPKFEIVLPEDLNGARVERDKALTEMGVRFNAEYYRDTYSIDPKYILGIAGPASQGSMAAVGAAFSEHTGGCCTGAEFAESDLTNILKSVTPEAMQGQMSELIQPILDLASKYSDFAEFDAALERLFPSLSFNQFQLAMEKCLLLSEMKGKVRG